MISKSNGPEEVVVVTGGSGFLGQHIVKQLIEQKEFPIREVRIFDLQPLQWHPGLIVKNDTNVSIKQYLGDLCKLEDLQLAFKGASVVIHNASIIDITTLPDTKKLHRVNVTGTEKIIKACTDNNIEILIYTSSASAVNKLGYYGLCKKRAEDLVLQTNNKELNNGNRLSTCALRLPCIYGEGEVTTHVLGCIKRNIAGNTFIRFGDETSKIQTAYIGNMAWAFVLAIRKLRSTSPTFAPMPAGRAIGVADDTPLSSYCSSFDPFLHCFNLKPSRFIIPFFILYILASICEWVSFLLQPCCTLRLPLSKVGLDHMQCLPIFNREEANFYLNYKPIYSYEESVKRTMAYLEHVK